MLHICSNATAFGGAEVFLVDLIKHIEAAKIWGEDLLISNFRSRPGVRFEDMDLNIWNFSDVSSLSDFLIQFDRPEDVLFLNVQWPESYSDIFSKLHLVKSKIHIHVHLFPYGQFPKISAKDFKITCVSQDIANRLKSIAGIEATVTGNQPTKEISSYLDIPISKELRGKVLSIGRVDSQKNFDEAIFLADVLQAKGLIDSIDWIGWDESDIGNLECAINFLGVQDVISVLSDYDVVVFFSKYEGLSLSLLEALAAGKLVLAPNVSSFSELIQNEYNGFLYEQNSVIDFFSSFQELSTNPEKVWKIRNQARLSTIDYCQRYQTFEILKKKLC